MRELERRLARLKRRHQNVYARWEMINRERLNLQYEIASLSEELGDLKQGQLLLEEDLG